MHELNIMLLMELRHGLCNYAFKPTSVLYRGTIISTRHILWQFFAFKSPEVCDISMTHPEDIPDEEYSTLKKAMLEFIDALLERYKHI